MIRNRFVSSLQISARICCSHWTARILHGPAVKAANTRALTWFTRDLCRLLDDGSEPKSRRRQALEELCMFYDICKCGGTVLSEKHAKSLEMCVRRFCAHYAWLAWNACGRGLLRWQVTPKFHYFFYFALRASYLNPRVQQTYIDESLIGRICKIYKSCLNGPFAKIVQTSVLRKYLLALQITLGMNE